MPRRSTPFQAVVYEIKRRLADANHTVTESAFLHDLVTCTAREVDVVLKAELAGQPCIMSFECIERSRRADILWVDTIVGKHRNLPTDVLVLVSLRGFTKEAERTAKYAKVQTVTPGKLASETASQIIRNIRHLWLAAIETRNRRVFLRIQETAHQKEVVVEARGKWIAFYEEGEKIYELGPFLEVCFERISDTLDWSSVTNEYKWSLIGNSGRRWHRRRSGARWSEFPIRLVV